jgi:hydrogenase expression/formation protein HypE
VLPEGKLPADVLNRLLLQSFQNSDGLVVGPSIGVDVGVSKSQGKYLVTSSDPITGASRRVGWHAVNVSANDVATSGIMPSTLCVVSLFPSGTSLGKISAVLKEIGSTAKRLGIAVAGGHTEITSAILHPVITVTCFGSGDRFVSAADAQAEDSILITKSAGIEGTSILAALRSIGNGVKPRLVARGLKLMDGMSIVEDARVAFATGKVHAMHDVTEGGVLGAVLEMSMASHVGFELDLGSIPVDESTRAISKYLKLDPLKLIGSGSLVIACSTNHSDEIASALKKKGIPCTEIGRFNSSPSKRELRFPSGERKKLRETSIEDELWHALSKYR